jgi:hypothetical protein
MSDKWPTAIICPIHKKRDRLARSNCRGISLLYVCYNVLTNILHRRLGPYAGENLGEYQCGIRKGQSTTENLFILKYTYILEKI